MTKHFAALLLAIPLWISATDAKPKIEMIDPRVIHASIDQRRQWVIEQAKGPGAWLFSRDYEWVLTAKSIGPKEATQLAYLFFYSTGTMGGYFDEPLRERDRFKFAFHAELGPTEGFPVFVESKTGLAWQEGQTDKVDTLSLIHLFTKHRKDEKRASSPSRERRPR